MPNEYRFDNLELLFDALVDNVSGILRAAINDKGHASMVVSGGKTPMGFFSLLSEQSLEWGSVWITLADERWVEPTHPDSNEAMVRQHLLRQRAAGAHFIGLKNRAATPFEGESECETALSRLPLPFDIVLLGMGDDGHTASLFPDAPQLAKALDIGSKQRCLGIKPHKAPHLRMTLTLPALLRSRRILLLFSGDDKYNVYRTALREPSPIEALPVRAILHQHEVPVDIYRC